MDDRAEAAQKAYSEASATFSPEILRWVGETIRGTFPTATTLFAFGDMEGAEFGFRLRGRFLLEDNGDVVMDSEGAPCSVDDDRPSATFVSMLNDEIHPQLDWLGELDGTDVWMGEQDIDLTPVQELRIVLDRDCPGCNWPEVVAVGTDAGPERVECCRLPPCGYSAPVSEWSPSGD